MLVLGAILIGRVAPVLALTLYPSYILLIIGIVLLGLCGNGYAHFGTPPGTRRRYWF